MSDDRPAGAWRQRLAREHGAGRSPDRGDTDVDIDAEAIVEELENQGGSS